MSDQPTAPRRAHHPTTPDRRATFLRVLSETGSFLAASRAATPHGFGDKPGYRTWLDLTKSDPEFAEQVGQARRDALGKLEAEILERAYRPRVRPIIDRNGNTVAQEVDWRDANAMLVRVLERLDPQWAPRKNFTGTVAHEHHHSHEHEFAFTIRAEHVLALPPERRAAFLADLEAIRLSLEPPKEGNAGNVIDAEYRSLPSGRDDPRSEGEGRNREP